MAIIKKLIQMAQYSSASVPLNCRMISGEFFPRLFITIKRILSLQSFWTSPHFLMSWTFRNWPELKKEVQKNWIAGKLFKQKCSIKCYTRNLKGKLQIKMKWATIKWDKWGKVEMVGEEGKGGSWYQSKRKCRQILSVVSLQMKNFHRAQSFAQRGECASLKVCNSS